MAFLATMAARFPVLEPSMSFTVYLSGEIHTDWRDEIRRYVLEA
ncbi:hypothetical protein [Halomonas gemina]|nr:hypothetical protein [Halomonas gemina]